MDYLKRKQSKRNWKKIGKANEEGLKRVRKKKGAKRRLCQGMCYQDPEETISAAFKESQSKPNDCDDEDDEACHHKTRSESGLKTSTSGSGGAAKPFVALAALKKGKAAVRLSTGVQISTGQPVVVKREQQASESPALAQYPDLIRRHMTSQGFVEPTPIQEQCWPACCSGQDVQAVAEPGSGKTLGYILPAFVRMKVGAE